MNKKYILEKLIIGSLKIFISAAFAFFVTSCWVLFFNSEVPKPFYRLGHYFLFAIVLVVYVYIANVYGAFHIGTSPVGELILSQIITIFIWQVICYFLFSLVSYRLVNVTIFLMMFLVLAVFASIWTFVTDKIYFFLHKPKKTLMIFGNVDSYLSLEGIGNLKKRFTVVKTVDCSTATLEQLYTLANEVEAVFLCGVPSDTRNEMLKYCVANKKNVYLKPKISDTILRGSRTVQLLNVPIYRCSKTTGSLLYFFAKRVLDILFALFGIIIASPFMLITALAIKLYDGGPVFYKQERYTKDKKIFKVIKFRSMRVDAEKDGIARLASENDSRITPVGKIIRKLRLDELPQLFNILVGSMSIVGPRPERPEIFEQYEKEMPEFALRLQVKAGLTGYAQVYGKYNTPPYDKVQMDLMYIMNQSFIEDIKLMMITFKIMFVSDSTEGVKEGQITADRKDTK